ncbi:MAG TPA: ATP-binding cassette domain-containing protein [Kiritimatiellia bacterium]|nr:ATP-binding cassette domain-containing protein [Kiritimatiellia bacterium]HQQ04847.1 ATP-binding cassette domain-containing protein [Kiritimatiellia bacterium]
MNPLLQIRDLQTWFPIHRGVISRTVGNVRAVDGVSLDIYPNETLGLVGESGCGKSTLARTIALLEQSRSGTMHFSGQALSQAQPGIRRKIQMIFQDPYSSLNPRMTVLEILTEGLVQHRRIKSSGRVTAAREILADVGMDPDVLYRYPHEFSGGQRQRISIGRALSLKPELLICDEAVSALDVSVQAQVINLLLSIRRKHGLSYLFISHDLGVVRHMADRVAVMYLGQIVEEGPADKIMDAPAHPYTQALISAIPRIGAEKGKRIVLQGDVPSPAAPPPGCRFHPRCPYAQDICRREQPELKGYEGGDSDRKAACFFAGRVG